MRNEFRNRSLPAGDPSGPQAGLERYAIYQAAPDGPGSEEPLVPLSHYFWILRRHKWSILAFVVISVAATIVASSRITPIYESTATLDVDRLSPTAVIGQEAGAGRGGTADTDTFLSTQIELIKSDSVLRPVARRFKMGAAETGKPTAASARSEAAPIGFGGLRVTRPPKTYILQISYRSPDPQFAADVANAVAQSYREHTFETRYRATVDLTTYMDKQL